LSSETVARETPLTSSSADRTALMQPSHIMPSTVNVTVDSAGLGGPPHAMRATRPTADSHSRLVIGASLYRYFD
jgi:hypothetical protein